MRKMLTAAIIAALIGVLGICEQNETESVRGKILPQVHEAEEKIEKNDFAGALAQTEKLKKEWSAAEKRLEVFVSHDDTGKIDKKLTRLEVCLKTKNAEGAVMLLTEIEEEFEQMKTKSKIKVSNIL